MNLEHATPPLVVVIGPTASGKSSLAVRLAEQLGGEVVACDSTQLYRGFDIGTAKPAPSERHGIPHHLIDVLGPEEAATAGGYRQMALAALADLRKRGRLPIFTVGTGLYCARCLRGWLTFPSVQKSFANACALARARMVLGTCTTSCGVLILRLRRKFLLPTSKNSFAPSRSALSQKKPLTELHRSGRAPLQGWRVLKIGLAPDREPLYARIHARTDAMLARGWLEEVRSLLEAGLPADAKPFDFIGYRELRAVLQGHITLDDAIAAIQQSTRRYAKRQLTWFRREPAVHWLEGFGDDALLQSRP